MSCSDDNVKPAETLAIHDKMKDKIGKEIGDIVSRYTEKLKASGVAHITILRNYQGDVVITPWNYDDKDYADTYPINAEKQLAVFKEIEKELEDRFAVKDIENDVSPSAASKCGIGSPVKLMIKGAAIKGAAISM